MCAVVVVQHWSIRCSVWVVPIPLDGGERNRKLEQCEQTEIGNISNLTSIGFIFSLLYNLLTNCCIPHFAKRLMPCPYCLELSVVWFQCLITPFNKLLVFVLNFLSGSLRRDQDFHNSPTDTFHCLLSDFEGKFSRFGSFLFT